MDKDILKNILSDLYEKKIDPQKAAELLSTLPYENLGFAKVDHHRSLRSGFPEVIYSKGKTDDQLISIIKSLYKAGNDILATKLNSEMYAQIKRKLHPESAYNEISSTLVIAKMIKENKFNVNGKTVTHKKF